LSQSGLFRPANLVSRSPVEAGYFSRNATATTININNLDDFAATDDKPGNERYTAYSIQHSCLDSEHKIRQAA
jgi:hypothetical protein